MPPDSNRSPADGNSAAQSDASDITRRHRITRFIPLALLACGALAAWIAGFHDWLTVDSLAAYRQMMHTHLADHGLIIGGAFILTLLAVAALSIPAVGIMNVAAGFLFGTGFGTIYAVIGQTMGALIIYLAVRFAFRDMIRGIPATRLRQMEQGFQRHALLYMVILRLAPFLPAWLVNIVPGLLGVKATTYFAGTFIGVVPCTFVFSSMGNGLGAVIDAGVTPDINFMTQPEILIPLLGLSVLALLPIGLRRWL